MSISVTVGVLGKGGARGRRGEEEEKRGAGLKWEGEDGSKTVEQGVRE